MKTRLFLSLVTVVMLGLPLNAQNQQPQEVLTFTRIDRNPRTSALAGAGAASVSSVAYASFVNAAAVPFYEEKADFGLGYQHWTPTLGAASAFHLGGAYNFGQVGVTLGGLFVTEQPDNEGFRPSKLQVNLGAGVRITDWLSAGVNARLAREGLFQGYAITGFNADVLLMARPVEGLGLTAGIANIGNAIKDSFGTAFPQPASVKLAAAYSLTFAGDNTVEVMADGDYYLFSRGYGVSAGLEYSFRQLLFLRVGYRKASDNSPFPTHLGLGAGLQIAGIRVEFAWLTASQILGKSFSVGLGYRF